MSATKCQQCGLINFASAASCKRCGLPFGADAGADDWYATGHGVWQHNGVLIIRFDGRLDDHCIKCNTTEGVGRKWVTASPYTHWKLLLMIFSWPIFPGRLLAKLNLFSKLEVEAALCRKHWTNWGNDLKINLPLMLIGIGLGVESFYEGSMVMLSIGILLFAVACLRSALGVDPLRLVRADGQHYWIKGAGSAYLTRLPRWTARSAS
jgi:hypothetical protein